MKPRQLAKTIALSACVVLVAASSLAAYRGLDKGEAFRLGPARYALADGFERSALRALTYQAPPLSYFTAENQSRQALELSPANNMPRIRLAYLDWVSKGVFTPAAHAALDQSYVLAPYDHEARSWRIRLALENWAELSPELRASVQREVLAFGRVRTNQTAAILRSVESPEGRLQAALWLRELPGKPSLVAPQHR